MSNTFFVWGEKIFKGDWLRVWRSYHDFTNSLAILFDDIAIMAINIQGVHKVLHTFQNVIAKLLK